MLRTTNDITGSTIEAIDGSVGKCIDFLFEDRHWAVRYMVASQNVLLTTQNVLISPTAVIQQHWKESSIPLRLTKNEIDHCPPLDSDAPVSRQYEKEYYRHFGYIEYWIGPDIWGTVTDPYGAILPVDNHKNISIPTEDEVNESNHLRSCNEVGKYEIHALDGDIGHIENFIFDDSQWNIVYVVINTRNWLPGQSKVIDIQLCDKIDWVNSKVAINLTKEQIEGCQDFPS